MITRPSLLPPNSTTLERNLEQSTARIADVPAPIKELWNPTTCPLELLPWLAWALSADNWEPDWSEAIKRQTVADAIEQQRHKGTPKSVKAVLQSFDELLYLTEWHQMQPRGEAHTFTVTLPLQGGDGYRASAEFAQSIIRDVTRAKPVRSHFILLQQLEAAASLRVEAAGRSAGFVRLDCLADTTAEPEWDTYWDTELGEPLELEGAGGTFLEVQ